MSDLASPTTPTPHAAAQPLDPALLAMLVCPLTRSRLRQEGDALVAEVGGLRYPIRDNIPILLINEAALPTGVGNLDELKRKFADVIPEM